jgi:polyhydroxyalkanoate synthase
VSVGNAAAARGALETLLNDAALDNRRRFLPAGAAVRAAAGIARRPRRPARRAAALGAELARVATGRSQLGPARSDRRFADRAWETNPLLRALLQAYLAGCDAVDGLIGDAGLDWRDERQARFAAGNVLDALSPSNFQWANPAVLRETVDQGGTNLARGARQFLRDVSRSPRLPASVDTSTFSVGENLAVTPGSVVLRTAVFELIQYRPRTPQVHEIPMLIVPPTINKFYVLDLAPGRSLVEHLIAHGQQVFTMSWRNPGPEHGHWDLDVYAEAVLEARAAAAEIARSNSVHLTAACSGGIISAGALAHRAAAGAGGEIASLTLLVCALDNERAGTAAALAGREIAAAAVAESARKGYVDGRALAGVFAWLRPNDLIWSYVVNNYLMGRKPPAFDVLYWNQDTVRLAAGLHRDFVRIALENSLARERGQGAGHARRPRGHRHRRVRRRGAQRSHRAVGERVSQRAAARRRDALRALDERPRPGARQPTRARQPVELPDRAGAARAARAVARRRGDEPWQLVERLDRLARRALGREQAGPGQARQPHVQGGRQGAGELCPRSLSRAAGGDARSARRSGRSSSRGCRSTPSHSGWGSLTATAGQWC